MAVLTANGQSVTDTDGGIAIEDTIREVELLTHSGEILHVPVIENPLGQSPMKFSLWALAGMFALLGAAVIVRRPDLRAARMFWVFAGFTAVALAIGPSSAGPGPYWARILEGLSLLGIGSSFLLFASALTKEPSESRPSLGVRLFAGFGVILVAAYGVSLLVRPSLYQVVRPMVLLYVSASALGGVGLLAIEVSPHRSPGARQQARLALWGTALGMLPFISLSFVPKALGQASLVPDHITILGLALMPAAFAYAILQYQLLGIRKLVHRGMVYGIVAVVLLTLIAVGLTVVAPLPYEVAGTEYRPLLIAAFLVAGIILFFPLRRAACWVVDNLIYRDAVDYQSFWGAVHDHFLSSDNVHEVATGMAEHLTKTLRLESVLLFLGQDPSRSQVMAQAGERASRVLQDVHPQLDPYVKSSGDREIVELHWESESLILVNLKVAGRYLGYMLLGPKSTGEIFVEEEKRLVAILAPMLALGIDKSELSEELRTLNRRLIKAEEAERARIAGDIHDGPLQKAVMLAAAFATDTNDQIATARELVLELRLELREVCSRLRPAILDDLGVVSAIEWLLEGVSKQSHLVTNLSVRDVGEEERFVPDVELVLFRVAQEASNNATKHSKGTRLDVSLWRAGDMIILKVEDNGVGFPVGEPKASGLGLSGMRERVAHVSGSLDIRSTPGLGTSVTASIPVSNRD